ncbi:MAG: TlpA family protein disulfide reductase [Anaerolineales bacterium]|nr:TlpA family protein disulfide reductase [Anaerolineales bacterium]
MKKLLLFSLAFSLLVFVLPACTSPQTSAAGTQEPVVASPSAVTTPEWFSMELTDAQTGETFTINDYSGKVVLLETMAMWCPNCLLQAGQVQRLHEALGNPEDLISISLDVDVNEDEASLKAYATEYGLDWHVAVAPLLVARALGNLYTAQYLNPPLSPMMIIDRKGNVHHLEYGLKDVETLQKALEPYLAE